MYKNLKADNELWEQTVKANNAAAFRTYVSSFPQGAHVQDAKQMLDDAVWNDAFSRNSADLYLAYMQEFPTGKHYQDAQSAYNKIQSTVMTAQDQDNVRPAVADRNITKTQNNEAAVEEVKPIEKKVEKEEVFRSVEQMPTFPGGDAALMKYLSSHLQYPTMAQENGVQGTVIVQFVVTKTGAVGEVKVARSVDRDLDKEAVRVCKSLPKFVPGRQNGQPVSVWYTLPVKFKLQQ